MKRESILVCGTGIVGLATALALARAGFSISLAGPAADIPAAAVDVYCPRVYALSPASRQFLESLGVWQSLDGARITAVDSMEVFGDSGGQVMLHAWQGMEPALAWIVEASALERILRQAVRLGGVAWHDGKIAHIEQGVVSTAVGQLPPADLVVGADGAASPVREAFGIGCRSHPYGDVGLVAHLTAEYPHQHAALQWFTGDSVLALLPMPDTRAGSQVSMVWSMPESDADQLRALPPATQAAAIANRLAAATGGRLGGLTPRTPLLGFPLFRDESGLVATGAALVGDAAHRVHPLAGQGVILGLADARALADVLAAKEAWRGVGDLRVLRRYRRLRAEALLSMRLATDGLYRLFALPGAPPAWLRNIGMQMVDRLPMVKRHLIAQASGRRDYSNH